MNRQTQELVARLRLLEAALRYRAPPISPRDFQVTRPTSVRVERPAHIFEKAMPIAGEELSL